MDTGSAVYHKLADPALLDKIDKLFSCNVGNHIDLPQLVVVGDQSSGKSSVLEGLTKLPFPRDSGLCTRFATKITFRRANETNISVSIIPAADASVEHASKIRAWGISGIEKLDAATFRNIMRQAIPSKYLQVHETMGLQDRETITDEPRTIFSEDVLNLEICGPEEDHLSIIDIPGIFKNTTPGLTTKQDMQMVRDMVQGYMKSSRSVMLTIVPANVDIATQEILEMAREVDPEGERTIGVFTKPDLVDKGAERRVIDLLEGKESGWKMGWSIVRNPGQKDLDEGIVDRDYSEANFFRMHSPWNTLDKEKVGVAPLRARLQEILTSHIRREFPNVKSEICKQLAVKKKEIESLGPERGTSESQAKYLLDIITRFQHIASLALNSNYGGDDLFDKESATRLATILVNRNEKFSDHMEHCGHKYSFVPADRSSDQEYKHEETDEHEHGHESADSTSQPKGKYANETIGVRSIADPGGLDDILYEPTVLDGNCEEDITSWLNTIFVTCRGFDLGTFNPSLLSTIIKKQTSKWESLSLGYISDTVCAVHRVILEILKYICTDKRVRHNLLSIVMDRLLVIYERARNHVKFLLEVERDGTPMTLNQYFNENLEICRQKRMEAEMKNQSFSDCEHGTVVRLEDIAYRNSMSNAEHTVQDLHDILESYYEVARKRFVDSVCMQAADFHLVTGPETPIKQFSPAFVQGLSPEQLEEIAGEDAKLKRKRTQLRKEIKELEAGRKILL
ncbi:hypothetical protein FQN55_002899 [Onygenales sp. PD_40]|nr:hypothetical protein FQN55_002899 [Onygenales sp. PD_40]